MFDNPELRRTLIAIQARDEQTVDVVSIDEVRQAGYSVDATAKALATVESFRQFILDHRDQIAALDIIYSQPYARRHLTFAQLAELAEQLKLPPHTWTTEELWRAYAQLERDKVREVRAKRVLTDLVSLGGKACIRGMRISVSLIVNLVANGMTTAEIIDEYPDLEPEDIRQALQYASWAADDAVHAPMKVAA